MQSHCFYKSSSCTIRKPPENRIFSNKHLGACHLPFNCIPVSEWILHERKRKEKRKCTFQSRLHFTLKMHHVQLKTLWRLHICGVCPYTSPSFVHILMGPLGNFLNLLCCSSQWYIMNGNSMGTSKEPHFICSFGGKVGWVRCQSLVWYNNTINTYIFIKNVDVKYDNIYFFKEVQSFRCINFKIEHIESQSVEGHD